MHKADEEGKKKLFSFFFLSAETEFGGQETGGEHSVGGKFAGRSLGFGVKAKGVAR
jgi:hypothetical protein